MGRRINWLDQCLILGDLDDCTPVWPTKQNLKVSTTELPGLHCAIRINTVNRSQQLSRLTLDKRLVLNSTVFVRNTGTTIVFTNFLIYSLTVMCDQVHSHLTTSADCGQKIIPYPKSNAPKKTVNYCDINYRDNCSLNNKTKIKMNKPSGNILPFKM